MNFLKWMNRIKIRMFRHMLKLSKTLLLFFALFLFLNFSSLLAEEKILSFDSDITINKDGSMLVTETIKVQAEGKQIKRGIYRDFPTDYKDRLGNNYKVDLLVLGVERDGQREQYHTKPMSNGVRIYFGSSNVFLGPGVYTYAFKYRTNYQLGFFAEHDELYWNVTGNAWDFSIDKATATVRLPELLEAEKMPLIAYTGRQGATEKNYTSSVLGPGVSFFETTKRLSPKQGLTIVTAWPKGVIAQPTHAAKFNRFISDNKHILVGLGGIAALFSYFILVWFKVGRDPGPGVIYPRYMPPKGYGPDELRYIKNMTYDDKTFSSALVDMATKNLLKITEHKSFLSKTYDLKRENKSSLLNKEQSAIIDYLFQENDYISLENENYQVINKAKSSHKRSLARSFKNKYFYTNTLFFVIGVLSAIAVTVYASYQTTMSGGWYGFSLFVGIALFFMCKVFYTLLKAPTKTSRKLLDEIDGFIEYMTIAEGQEIKYMELTDAPDLNKEIFEKYLPYAIALDVEQDWAAKFTRVFARLTGEQPDYSPSWFHGSSFNTHNLGGFTSSLASTMNSTISSASTPPGSSSGGGGFSGGGGGSSGGGGGGGGGGGW